MHPDPVMPFMPEADPDHTHADLGRLRPMDDVEATPSRRPSHEVPFRPETDLGEPDLEVLRHRAFNLRWATVDAGVIPLTAADPDLPVPSCVQGAIAAYTDGGHLSYGPSAGLPEFRSAVAAHFLLEKAAPIERDRVIAANAAASAIALVARHLLVEGDEVVAQDPVDFLVSESVRRTGARTTRWRPTGGRFTLDGLRAAVTQRTRAIFVCHPHNPLGTLLAPGEVRAIADFASERGITIVSDEVWSDVVLDGRSFRSFAAHGQDGCAPWVVYGLSKGYALAGLRIGAVVAPSVDAARRFARTEGFEETIEGASTLSQVAATAALGEAGAWRRAFLRHAATLRDRAVETLAALDGVRIARAPEATFVLFADISGTGLPAEVLAERLESIARVRVVPGAPRWFGEGARGHIRLSLATSETILDEALGRIARAWPQVIARTPGAS